jgi:hypothetical protein
VGRSIQAREVERYYVKDAIDAKSRIFKGFITLFALG